MITEIEATDTVKDALLTKTNDNINEHESEIDALDARVTAVETAVAAAIAGSGVLISLNDTTVGVLNGKLIVTGFLILTENNDGGSETLTLENSNVMAWF